MNIGMNEPVSITVCLVTAAGLDPNRHIEVLPSIDFSKLYCISVVAASCQTPLLHSLIRLFHVLFAIH